MVDLVVNMSDYVGYFNGGILINVLVDVLNIGVYFFDLDLDILMMIYVEQLFVKVEVYWCLG